MVFIVESGTINAGDSIIIFTSFKSNCRFLAMDRPAEIKHVNFFSIHDSVTRKAKTT